ncbi:MAG: phosphoribosylformylglycinamidine cyclo-ligase [Promethearchaeia archaeon]
MIYEKIMSGKKEDLYGKLGVSSQKEDVHEVIKHLDQGLFPGAFCKIVEDIRHKNKYCSVFHSDGAGTKTSLAYMYYKETGDLSVFKGIVQDAMVMNIDDMLCVGATGPIFFSNNIGRNSNFIDGKVIDTIISGYHEYAEVISNLGLEVIMCGGETADVGDLVKTLIVDASAFTTLKRKKVINAGDINKSDVIVGLASFGQTSYEDNYNSGIGSNGLTLARHGTLDHSYYEKFPECYDKNIDPELAFFGDHTLTESISNYNLDIGRALLSPTRTYTPVILEVLREYRDQIHGIIHNTGGGQTKCLKFGKEVKYIKDSLFKLPRIFRIIQKSSNTTWREMYQVFNMGHRLEFYCNEDIANEIIKYADKFNLEAKIIGHCEKNKVAKQNSLKIDSDYGEFEYS